MKIPKRAVILLVSLMLLSCKQKIGNGNSPTQEHQNPDIKRPENTCRVNILNQVNGAYARDLRLIISESDTKTEVFNEICQYGIAFPKLEVGKHYDFAVKGNASHSSSLVKNLKIKTSTDDIGIVCLIKAQKNRNETFLNLKEFKFIKEGGSETVVIDGVKIETPIKGKFTAKVSSSSAAIYDSFANGFAAKIGLGKTPSSSWHPIQDIKGSPSEYPKFENGEWVTDFSFLLEADGVWESITKDEQDLIAVFYDVAGNRLEAHNYVVCEPKIANFEKYTGTEYSLSDFYVEAKTYSAYNQIYSALPSYSGENEARVEDVHYAPTIFFNVRDKNFQIPKIIAVEVFRREVIEGKETEFLNVFTSYFRNPSNVRESNSNPIPFLLDRTGTCEVNKEYEYKAKIYIKDGFYFESDIAKCKVLPQYRVFLTKPTQHASVTMPARFAPFNEVLQDFAISISEPSLWDAKKTDYFTCGLVVNTFRNAEMYRMMFRYHFNYKGTGKEELEFLANYNQQTIKTTLTELKAKKIIPYYVEVKDFVEWDASNSQVILKKEMLTTRVLNITDRWDTFKDGEIYYWDVFGVSGELPDSTRQIKKMPPVFTKEYKNEKGIISYSNTYGAGLSLTTTSSANGRFDFTVKSENKLSNSSLLERPSMENIVEGVYVVKADSRFEKATLQLGLKIVGKMSLNDDLSWYCVSSDSEKDILPSLLKVVGVRNADYEHKISLPYNKSEQSVLRGLSVDGDVVFKGSGYSLEITKALKAYEEIGFGDGLVLAGIVDTGVSSTHEDLKDSNGEDIIKDHFVQDWQDQGGGKVAYKGWVSSKAKMDLQGHGTHCIGIMAASEGNGKGIVGVSGRNTKVVMYRGMADDVDKNGQFREFCTMDAIRKFTDYVKNMRANGQLKQACVPINLSIGDVKPSVLGVEVINYALANGVLPVVAMGNDGLRTPSYPAAYKGVIAVGSSNGSDKVSSYSNTGAWISIVAPGENIVSLKHDNDKGYVTFNGTSMAAPFVAGAVSYLAGLDPSITPQQMKSILERTADKIEGGEDFNIRRGYGRINVYKAAKLIKEGGQNTTQTKYSSFALKAKIEPKFTDENGEHDINFGNFVPYVFLYDDRGVCVAGGYVVAPDAEVNNKENMNVVEFRGLEKGRYTLKVDSYVYTDWPIVYRLLDEKAIDFTGEKDEMVDFGRYVVIKK